ncbi:MAG TPA: HlyD family type I secretion periplasmic adaptor subunit [Stellaceae bacterium]|nr:HlyD family type I secretion periplasmic adaptor subunit [Stellaceae bacterium]
MTAAAHAAADAAEAVAYRGIAPRIRAGLATGAALVGALAVWSALAPIESAAIAPGTVKVESTRKTLQHLEGGVIRQILVAEGSQVKAGDVLLRLDPTKARANRDTLVDQFAAALADEARLRAEFAGRAAIELPPELAARRQEPRIAEIMTGQERILAAHQALLRARIAVWEERAAQSRSEMAGMKAQDQALERQLALIAQETADSQTLLAKGLERRPHMLALERTRADLEGRRADLRAQSARALQVIAESAAQVASVQYDSDKDLSEQLRDAEARAKELREQVQVASDVLARTELRAPVAGTVTDLRVHTIGGVIAPGDRLMDIVPARDRLLVEVEIRPEDIYLLHRGQRAQVRLLAYRQRVAPALAATLDYVAPDLADDKRSDQPHYTGRVVLDQSDLGVHPEIRLVAGMQAEVMIATGHTTVALYALSPLLDVFRRAMRDR